MNLETVPMIRAYELKYETTQARRDLDRLHEVLKIVCYYEELFETDDVKFI